MFKGPGMFPLALHIHRENASPDLLQRIKLLQSSPADMEHSMVNSDWNFRRHVQVGCRHAVYL